MNATAMRRHVREIAAQNGIVIRWIPVRRSYIGWADHDTRTITIGYIGSVKAYATAMHELGHVLSGVTSPRETDPDWSTVARLRNEAAAWDWALQHMPSEVAHSDAVTTNVILGIRSYLWSGVCGDGLPANDELFWRLLRLDWSEDGYWPTDRAAS